MVKQGRRGSASTLMVDNSVYITPEPVLPATDSESFGELFELLRNAPDIQENGLISPEDVDGCLQLLDAAWPKDYNSALPVLPVRTSQQAQRLVLYLVMVGFHEQKLTYNQLPVWSEEPESTPRSLSGASSAANTSPTAASSSSTAASSSSAAAFSSPPLKRKRGADDAQESAAPSLKEQLARLHSWLDEGVIEQQEYDKQRRDTVNAARLKK